MKWVTIEDSGGHGRHIWSTPGHVGSALTACRPRTSRQPGSVHLAASGCRHYVPTWVSTIGSPCLHLTLEGPRPCHNC